MAASSVLAFWVVALLLIICPGADWAFTLSAGLGRRSVLPAVGGLLLGYLAVTLVVAAGVGALVAGSPAILTGLTVVGGAYLTWHGATTLAQPAVPTGAVPTGAVPTGAVPTGAVPTSAEPYRAVRSPGWDWTTLVRGIGVSGLNPKGLLIFLALLPQFTTTHGSWPVAVQIGLLGLTFMATCGVFYLGLGVFARSVLHARPAAGRAVSRLSGAAMIVIGALLLIERLVG